MVSKLEMESCFKSLEDIILTQPELNGKNAESIIARRAVFLVKGIFEQLWNINDSLERIACAQENFIREKVVGQ